MKYTGILAAAAAAAIIVGYTTLSHPSLASSEPNIGEARSALRWNVRQGPGKQFSIVYTVGRHERLYPVCYTFDNQGNRWYQLRDGNYTESGNMSTSEILPQCGGGGTSN